MTKAKPIPPQHSQFKPGQSGNPNGRPKRLYQQMKGKGYSKDDVRACYATLADYSKEELDKLIKDKKATVLEVSIARAFSKAMSQGEYRLIKDIVELFADKPKQSVEASVSHDVAISKPIILPNGTEINLG